MLRWKGRLAPCLVGFAALALALTGCGSKSTNRSGKGTIAYSRVVDLTHTIDPSIPLWPGDPHVVFKVVATMKKDGYYLRSFTIGEHSATHMNAPTASSQGTPSRSPATPSSSELFPPS